MNTKHIINNISAAAEIINKGGIVAVPTETVYGLAANAYDVKAVENIYKVKGRPENKPLSLMVGDASAIDTLCEDVPPAARFLADCFWPGPLTIVLKAKDVVPEIIRAGGSTVALRCPLQDRTLGLINESGVPLAAPSANPTGCKSPVTAEEVLLFFDGKIDAVIDGGKCVMGRESTIIDMSKTPYTILRHGSLAERDLNMALAASLTIIGITGGTGCGKTTALGVFKEMGGLVIDCDEVYHDLLKYCDPMIDEVNERFPGINASGSVDTKLLGEIVFKDPSAMRDLSAITHRYVGEEINCRVQEWARNGGTFAAIDAIALFESGIGDYCHTTVGITAPTEDRIQRLMKREGISLEYAQLRIDAQKSNQYFEEKCDYIVENDVSHEVFNQKCKAFFEDIIRR